MTALDERLASERIEHNRLESQMHVAVLLRDDRSAIAFWFAIDASDRRIEQLKAEAA